VDKCFVANGNRQKTKTTLTSEHTGGIAAGNAEVWINLKKGKINQYYNKVVAFQVRE